MANSKVKKENELNSEQQPTLLQQNCGSRIYVLNWSPKKLRKTSKEIAR